MSDDPATRVAFLVTQELQIADWHVEIHSPNLASLVLSLAEERTYFFNVYNDISATSKATNTPILHEARAAIAKVMMPRTEENG